MTDGQLDRAKCRLRLAQDVLRCYTEGLGASVTATRLGVHRTTVWRTAVWLGLERETTDAARETVEA